MKLLFILMALPVLATNCKKEKDKNDYLEGKVVRWTCASFVMQVTNDDSIGEDGWKDIMSNNKQYDNVITVNNFCKESALTQKALVTFRFKIKKAEVNDCVMCAMADAPPTEKYDLTDVSIVEN